MIELKLDMLYARMINIPRLIDEQTCKLDMECAILDGLFMQLDIEGGIDTM